jgi:1-acyl-sn-glycerol-3-phosphate acyltransferase
MIAAIRSLATYVAVSLYVAIVGPPFILIALLFGARKLLYRVGHGGVRLALFLSGLESRLEGAEHIQRGRAAVYAVNHTSNVEPPLLFDALHELFPRLRVLYKAELRKLPVLVRAFDLAGFVPSSVPTGGRACRPSRRLPAPCARETPFSSSLKGPAAVLASCCRSRRAGSSWPSKARPRSSLLPSRAPATRCGRAARGSSR